VPLAKAFDIDKWAGKIAAPGDFPRLVRRLVLATAKVSEISFPADEGIWLSGWDGRVTATGDSAHVPSGSSKWELGVGKGPARKAKREIRNRANTPAIERAQTTFVFVTPRTWPKKLEWQKNQRAEGGWRDILAFDSHDLETWLELAPAVHVWFSRLIGIHSGAEEDFESYWRAYSNSTKPALPQTLLLKGREVAAEELRSWLSSAGEKPTFALQSESREEATAFAIASLLSENADEICGQGLVVSDRAAWDQLAISSKRLLLVPAYSIRDEITTATQNGHRVLVPLGYSEPDNGDAVQVPRLPVRSVAQWLEESGFPNTVAWEHAKIARRSLTAFRRQLAERPEARSPVWANPTEGPHLTSFLLAGSWKDSSHADRAFLEQLSGQPYRDLEKLAQRHSDSTDSLLRRLDSTWLLASTVDAWGLLGRYVSDSEFEVFERLATEILRPSDPEPFCSFTEALQAPAERRPSRSLVQCLAETLALLGASPDLLPKSSARAKGLVGRITSKVLAGAETDVSRWRFLCSYGVLTDLALAEPDAFLGALERSIVSNSQLLEALFEESEGGFLTSHSPHIDLLWSLAALAWSPELLSRVVEILAKLTTLDPGGNVHPRPGGTLQAIFQPIQPATSATWQVRRALLDRLLAQQPGVAVPLVKGLLDEDVWEVPTLPHFRWRDWAPNGTVTSTDAEVWEQVGHFTECLLRTRVKIT
jgi:hypothetical protein